EGAKFPRFAVGEIIAPTALWRMWNRLGITQEMLDGRFIRKWGASWMSPNGTVFDFEQDVHPEDPLCRPFVYTFDRGEYDHFLLNHAREMGVVALEEAWVEDILKEDGRVVGVRFSQHGKSHEVRCKLLVDASGRANFLPRKLGLRTEIDELHSFSVFAHYEGVKRDEGKKEGLVRLCFGADRMWFWWAPLLAPKASIGIVADRETHGEEYERDPEAFFEKWIQTNPYVWDRIKDAKRVTGFERVEKGTGGANLDRFAARSTELVGDGWVLIGDSAGFIDPIFSAGLFVVQNSAAWLADEVLSAMEEGDLSKERLSSYPEKYLAALGDILFHIQGMALLYYEPKFIDFFLEWGNRNPKMRDLYIRTFIAYDPDAIAEFGRIFTRLFKRFQHEGGLTLEMTDEAQGKE
ncbi:tryptophan 7-halogenase, partial [bacterium]|nr:tryptophan 7-halogenase [bacterium]